MHLLFKIINFHFPGKVANDDQHRLTVSGC